MLADNFLSGVNEYAKPVFFEFYSQKWAWGTEKIALNQFEFFISKSIYQLITCCISVCQKRKSPSQ
jgi:hypothetical protein